LINTSLKGRQRPKLLSPINSFEGAVRVIRAGADELYCGVKIPGIKHFVLFRGSRCEIPTYDEFGKVVKHAHDHDVEVFLVVNIPFMIEAMEKDMRKHICLCLDKNVDALIIGNMGILSMVKSMDVDIPFYASTYMMSLNNETIDFLRKLGFSRVILERHLTVPEISEIVQRSKVEIEAFIHGAGCSNINRNCNLYHFRFPVMNRAISAIEGFNQPCRLPFDVYDMNNGKIRGYDAPILDAYTFCSLCRLPELVRTGVTGLKIVGRCDGIAYQEKTTKIYRELMDLLARDEIESFKEKLDSVRRSNIDPCPALQELSCEQKRCYYPPLFHAAYKLPISWQTWTRLKFMVV